MKLTLLQLVQGMLSCIDSENVESVDDTEEAGQCVEIANSCYEQMITQRKTWRHLRKYSRLNTTVALNELTVPDGTMALDPYNLYYNKTHVRYLTPEQFLSLTVTRNTDEANIETHNMINVYIDREPTYFTTDDDYTLRFDAIPNNIDGLNGNNVSCIIYQLPTTRLVADDEYFDLPPAAFPALLRFCKGVAKLELQGDNVGAEAYLREYKLMEKRLIRTGQVIDERQDIRKWIVPRQTKRVFYPEYLIS